MSFSFSKSPSAPDLAPHHRIGNQRIWFEEPDVFRMQFNGTLTGDELAEVFKYEDEWAQGKSSFFVIVDAQKLKFFSTAARQVLK